MVFLIIDFSKKKGKGSGKKHFETNSDGSLINDVSSEENKQINKQTNKKVVKEQFNLAQGREIPWVHQSFVHKLGCFNSNMDRNIVILDQA